MFAGSYGSANNQLYYPYSITRDSSGSIYVSDFDNSRVMKYVSGSTTGTVVAGGNGAGTSNNQLYYPLGIVYQSSTNSLLIANYYAHNIVNWVIGATTWTLVAGVTGTCGSTSTMLCYPVALAMDYLGNLYVSDASNDRVQFFRAGQSNGTTIAGITGSPGSSATQLSSPYGVAVDSNLTLYVADTGNQRIQKYPHV